MEISFNTHASNLTLGNGYGVAGYGMLTSLKELGHEVPFRSTTAPVEIAFCQPEWVTWSNPDAYHIQYTPWESTELPEGWLDHFNNNCDEVWTPSPLIAEWYRQAGVNKPVKVYQHGVDHVWSPRQNPVETSRFTFLHTGEPAPRKGGQMVVDAFLELYGDSKDHLLILKVDGRNTTRLKDRSGSIIGDIRNKKNIKIIDRKMPEPELINLFRSVNAMVYPSYGEGFGLIPLQSMAAGVPTICTESWAPYGDFIIPELRLASELIKSPWPHMHPGKMFQPSYNDLLNSMQYAEENETKVTSQARANALDIHKRYDWVRLTEEAFTEVVNKFA